MHAPDAINGSFEVVGGVLQWLNVKRLLRDQKIAGVDWRIWGFYSAWGLWNLFYYPSLDQWASLLGGVVLVTGNIVWLALAIDFVMHPAGFAPKPLTFHLCPHGFEDWDDCGVCCH